MSTVGKISLQSDDNGLITLQCNRCRSRFKIECAFIYDELEGDICCPSCGISAPLNTFYPVEAVEAAKQMAIAEAEEMIKRAFKGMNSKYIKVVTTPTTPVNRNCVLKNKDYDMEIVTVNCCNKELALMRTDITSGFYCPYCGRIVK